MSTTTIMGFPTRGTVLDTTYFATQTGGTTEKIAASSLKNYVSQLTNIDAAGVINAAGGLTAAYVYAGTLGNIGANIVGNVITASQPFITRVGTLNNLSVTGNILLNGSVVYSAANLARFAAINGTVIGNTIPAAGTFTSLISESVTINGPLSAGVTTLGQVTGTVIRASTNFIPTANLIASLGTSTAWFQNLYVNN